MDGHCFPTDDRMDDRAGRRGLPCAARGRGFSAGDLDDDWVPMHDDRLGLGSLPAARADKTNDGETSVKKE